MSEFRAAARSEHCRRVPSEASAEMLCQDPAGTAQWKEKSNSEGANVTEEIEHGAVVNTSPRPRMLIRGFAEDKELVNELLQICPTAQHITSLRKVRQAEWDLLVTDSALDEKAQYSGVIKVEPHLCVVYRDPQKSFFQTVEEYPGRKSRIGSHFGIVSQEIRRIRHLPERIATLTHEQLEPVIIQRNQHLVFERREIDKNAELDSPAIFPFIATADGQPLAGKYSRSDSSEAWLLPADTPDLASWVRAALAEWHGLAPDRFPGVPDWSNQEKWLTSEEIAINAEIDRVEKERSEHLDRLRKIESELRTRLASARELADKYERALLTTQSDELKQVVIQALRDIGFTVVDADEHADPDDHLEDLHVMDPDAPNWVALGEVKGYSRGAKTEGLTQFLRFNMRYTSRTGRNPDACWYIVNQFIKRDPSVRQKALHGKDEDVRVFGEANGLVIDTVQLFHLLRKVKDGELSAKASRELLRNASGRFTL